MLKRWAGFTAIIYIVVIIGWIVFHIIYSNLNPFINTGGSMIEQGLHYYSDRFSIVGFDHGTKAILFLFTMIIPITFFIMLHKKNFHLEINLIALISGILSYFILSVSFILQATIGQYAVHLYKVANSAFEENFAINMYDLALEKGGFSVSLYIIANILLVIWVFLLSYSMKKVFNDKRIYILGFIYSILLLISQIITFIFLMQGIQNMHDLDELIGLIGLVWFAFLAIRLLKNPVK